MAYNLVLMIAALAGWGILYGRSFCFEPGVLLYSAGFGISYAITNIGLIYALRFGSVSLSNLMLQLSLLVVALWGFVFWGSEFTVTVAAGLILVIVSLVLCLYQKGGGEISVKWVIFSLLALFGNAGCSIIQKSQQIAYHYQYGNMLMFFAMVCSLLVSAVIYWRTRVEKTADVLKKFGYLPVLSGGMNILLNVSVILLAATELSPSLIYPVIGVGGIVLNSFVSRFLFHERLRKMQWLGIAAGTVAVALLSL